MDEDLTEKETNDAVVAQTDDDNAWEKPNFVNRNSALLDNLKVRLSLDEFLKKFPTVEREQAVQVLDYLKSTLNNIKKAA